MNFSKNFISSWNIIQDQVKQFSDDSSPCPDLPWEIWCKGQFLQNSKEALAVLAWLPILNQGIDGYFRINNIRIHLFKMTKAYGSQGEWKIVEEILTTTDSLTIEPTWSLIMKNMNEYDWYGNFIPLLLRTRRAMFQRKVYSLEDKRPVRKPQRKRGYDDKGSLRPAHRWLPWNAYARNEVPEKILKEPQPFRWFSKRRR